LITSANVADAKKSAPSPWFPYQSPIAKLIK
jgi:hypothetical protein